MGMSSAASVVGSWYGGLSMVDSRLSLTSRPSLTQTPAHSDQQWFEPCELVVDRGGISGTDAVPQQSTQQQSK